MNYFIKLLCSVLATICFIVVLHKLFGSSSEPEPAPLPPPFWNSTVLFKGPDYDVYIFSEGDVQKWIVFKGIYSMHVLPYHPPKNGEKP